MNKISDSSHLKNAGLKITVPRTKILALFETAEQKHLSADDVCKILLEADEDISIATVYRVLTQFEQAGILNRHNFDGGHSVFELNYGGHHDHLLCLRCGKISEFFDQVIEERQIKIAEEFGYKITSHNMIIYGICNECK